jgi:hypothetical protein
MGSLDVGPSSFRIVVEEVTYPEQTEALARAPKAATCGGDGTDLAEIALMPTEVTDGERKRVHRDGCHARLDARIRRSRAFRRLVRERIGSARFIDTARIVDAARGRGALGR